MQANGGTNMDLNTVSEVARPSTRDEIPDWRDSDAWLAGGTWLFSEPQPGVRRLIDLEGLRWEPLQVNEPGLAIAATCTISQLDALAAPREWTAAPLIRQCCQSLLASFKIWNTATVGGNICMSLPAGAMISLTAALEGVCTIWQRDGGRAAACGSWISSPAFTRTSSDRAICFAASTCRHPPFTSERAFAECR